MIFFLVVYRPRSYTGNKVYSLYNLAMQETYETLVDARSAAGLLASTYPENMYFVMQSMYSAVLTAPATFTRLV